MKTGTRIFATILVSQLAIMETGCIPGITWLPDSSGFIFAGKDGESLMLIARGTQRALVANTQCQTLWPGVSPDGKQIAVARLVHEKKKLYTLQVFIYGLDGKVTHRSSVFSISETTQANKSGELAPTELFWAPNNKIVISAWTESGTVAIYDVKADQIVTVQDAKAAAFAGKPFRQDGKGFLVTKNPRQGVQMSFVDWKGHEHPVALNLPAKESRDLEDLILFPSWCTSSWEGNKAKVSTSQARLEFDTDKLTGSYQRTALGQPNAESLVRQYFVFTNGSNAIQIVDWKKKVGPNPELHLSRLELVDVREKKVRTLDENQGCAILFPSPNGKFVAVRWLANGQNEKESKESIWVIDQDGKIVAKFKVSE